MRNKKRSLLKKYQLGTLGTSFGGFNSPTFETWSPSTSSPTYTPTDPSVYLNSSVVPEDSFLLKDYSNKSSNNSSEIAGGVAGGVAGGLGAVAAGLSSSAAGMRANTRSEIDPRNIYAYDPSKSGFQQHKYDAKMTAQVLGAAGGVASSIPNPIAQIIGAGLGVGAAGTEMGLADLEQRLVRAHDAKYKERINVGGRRGDFTTQGQFTTMEDPGRNITQAKMGGYLDKYRGGGLYANIHAKRARIKAGSGEKMRSPGDEGAPTAANFERAAKTAKKQMGGSVPEYGASGMVEYGKGGMMKYMSGGMRPYQMGGEVNVIYGDQPGPKNAEVENNETIAHSDGSVTLVKGKPHEEGGVKLKLKEGGPAEGGDYVFSDHLKTQDPETGEIMSMAELHLKYKDDPRMMRWVMQTQEQLAGRENSNQDQMALEQIPSAKTGGMLKKYQNGTEAYGKRTFGEKMADYTPEILAGASTIAPIIAAATVKNPYESVQVPKGERVQVEKQFFERVNSRADEAQNARGASLSKQLLQQAGFGPGETAAVQKVELDRQAADAQATQRAREFNVSQDRAEKQLNTEMKLRADMANQDMANKFAELKYARDLGENTFESQRATTLADYISGSLKDAAAYAGDYRQQRAIYGNTGIDKRSRGYDAGKARKAIEEMHPYDSSKYNSVQDYNKYIDQLMREDAKKYNESKK